jgi:hypothetical protein
MLNKRIEILKTPGKQMPQSTAPSPSSSTTMFSAAPPPSKKHFQQQQQQDIKPVGATATTVPPPPSSSSSLIPLDNTKVTIGKSFLITIYSNIESMSS